MVQTRLFDAPQVKRLQTIMQSIHSGELRLPNFQRPFVWSTEQRLLLLDSVLSGMPIGSLLVWRTAQRLETQPRLGPHRLPDAANKPTAGSYNYVLDGLQRLSTLYAALMPVRADADTDGMTDDDDDGVRWPIYFDLRADLDNGDHRRFQQLTPAKAKARATWLPLSVLFDDRALWQHQIQLFNADLHEEGNKAKHLAQRFWDYEIAIVPIVTDDQDLATKTFERVNTQGTRMGEPHMLRALIYTTFKLDDEFESVVTASDWPSIRSKLLVNTLKALLGEDVYAADMRAVGRKIEAQGSAVFDTLTRAVAKTTQFLRRRCGVHGEGPLPYAYQFVALALAAAQGHELENADVVAELKRWFWGD